MSWITTALTTAALSGLIYAAAKAAAGTAASELVKWVLDAQIPVWSAVAAGVVCLGVGGGAVHVYHTGEAATWSPRIEKAESVDWERVPAATWQTLAIGDVPTETDTVKTVIPRRPAASRGNALTEVHYSGDLLETNLTLPKLRYITVGMKGGRRPAIDVGPDRVTLYGNSPNTGRPLRFTYGVPKNNWSVDVEGTLTAAASLPAGELQAVSSAETFGISYTRGPWAVRLAAGIGTTIGAESLQVTGLGELAVSYELASW